jgi:hypothetical protein
MISKSTMESGRSPAVALCWLAVHAMKSSASVSTTWQ